MLAAEAVDVPLVIETYTMIEYVVEDETYNIIANISQFRTEMLPMPGP